MANLFLIFNSNFSNQVAVSIKTKSNIKNELGRKKLKYIDDIKIKLLY